jgi:hypothetical protein
MAGDFDAFGRTCAGAVDASEQEGDGEVSNFFFVGGYCRKRGDGVATILYVVEAYDGNIFGDTVARFMYGSHYAKGEMIVEAEDGVRWCIQ